MSNKRHAPEVDAQGNVDWSDIGNIHAEQAAVIESGVLQIQWVMTARSTAQMRMVDILKAAYEQCIAPSLPQGAVVQWQTFETAAGAWKCILNFDRFDHAADFRNTARAIAQQIKTTLPDVGECEYKPIATDAKRQVVLATNRTNLDWNAVETALHSVLGNATLLPQAIECFKGIRGFESYVIISFATPDEARRAVELHALAIGGIEMPFRSAKPEYRLMWALPTMRVYSAAVSEMVNTVSLKLDLKILEWSIARNEKGGFKGYISVVVDEKRIFDRLREVAVPLVDYLPHKDGVPHAYHAMDLPHDEKGRAIVPTRFLVPGEKAIWWREL